MSLSQTNKIAYLEGLRGLASVFVLFLHLKLTFFIDLEDQLTNVLNPHLPIPVVKSIIYFVSAFYEGNLSVHIFWILSAYVITIKLFASREKTQDDLLLYFSFKRYFRLLLPCLGSVLIAYLLFSNDLIYNRVVATKLGKGYSDGWLGMFFDFTPNFWIALRSGFFDSFFDFNMPLSYNPPLWSIMYEFYGSLFLFGLFGITGKTEKRFWIYLAIFLVAFYIKAAFVLCFVIGFIISDIMFSENAGSIKGFWNGIGAFLNRYSFLSLLFLLLVLTFGKPVLYHLVPYEIINALLSCIIMVLVLQLKVLHRFFSLKVFVWLGKVSFSLYLLHTPILFSLTCWLYLQLPTWPHLHAALLCCALCILLSFVAAHFYAITVDDYSVKFANKIGKVIKNRQEKVVLEDK